MTDHELGPIEFELMNASLISTADEMGALMKRSSFSPIIREMDDFSCAVFDDAGNLVAQADYIPAQLGAMSLVVGSTLARWGDGIEPGDVFIANHPYMGCMHTPDVNVLMPVFIEEKLAAWTGTTAHHIDVGGVNPGTEGADLRQIYAEGLILPPVRLYRGGERNRDVFDIVLENVRDPRSTVADLQAQQAACSLGERRLLEVVDRYGASALRSAFARSLDVVERAARLALLDLPDGRSEAEGFLDDDGIGGPPTRIHVAIEKIGDRLTVDLSDTAQQIGGALNVPWASTRACLVFLIRAVMDADVSTNDGLLRVLDVDCPEGTVLNPTPPAAVSVRHNTCQRLADTLLRAASNLWPDRGVASSSVAFADINLESVSPVTGHSSVMMDVIGGGTGAHRDGDGLDGVDTYMSNVGLLPIEVAETEYSVRIRRTELRRGSQGRGRFNGGLGIRREYEILDRPQVATIYSEQTNPDFAPLGLAGGQRGGAAAITILGPDGNRIPAPSKVTLQLEPGSVVVIETSGGGGFGDVDERDPDARSADVEDQRIPADDGR
jgi:N-methylhydantoinase B